MIEDGRGEFGVREQFVPATIAPEGLQAQQGLVSGGGQRSVAPWRRGAKMTSPKVTPSLTIGTSLRGCFTIGHDRSEWRLPSGLDLKQALGHEGEGRACGKGGAQGKKPARSGPRFLSKPEEKRTLWSSLRRSLQVIRRLSLSEVLRRHLVGLSEKVANRQRLFISLSHNALRLIRSD